MNRQELSWALRAVIPHAGGTTVGLEQRHDWLYVYATDGYTLGVARVPIPSFVPLQHTLTAKEAIELEHYVRPNLVAEKDGMVGGAVRDTELHIGIADESGVFDAKLAPDGLTLPMRLIHHAIDLRREWTPIAVNPAYLARFLRAGDALRFEAKSEFRSVKGEESGALLVTSSDNNFTGLVMNLAYAFTPALHLVGWPLLQSEAA